jgi:formylglycine-generating enzyme required for sulfatase activity
MIRDWRLLIARRMLLFTISAFAAAVSVGAEPTRTVDLGDGVQIEFILVPPGTFVQGSPADEKDRNADETQRTVTIGDAFYLAKTEITRGQFAKFVAATKYKTESEKGPSGGFGLENGNLVQKGPYNWRNPGFDQTDDHPVVLVSYNDAQAFTKWLSEKARQEFLLPTEAEFEYALRAGSTTAFYTGHAAGDTDRIAWHKGTAGNGTRPVGQKEPNAWGFVDLAGNAWEWCRDWYGPRSGDAVTDPFENRSNLSDKPRRVVRGGSFLKDPKNARSAGRFRLDPGTRNADVGFRIMFRPSANVAAVPAESTPEIPIPAPVSKPPGSENQKVAQQPNTLPPSRVPVTHSPLPSSAGGGSLLTLACPCVLIVAGGAALLILLVIWLGKRRRSADDFPGGVQPNVTPPPGRKAAGSKPPRAPRIVTDGFWLEDPAYAAGNVVRYSCNIGHTPTSGEFTVGPGHQGHFVYTGGTPSDIRILEILPGAGILPGSGPTVTGMGHDDILSTGSPTVVRSSGPSRTHHTQPPPPPPVQPARGFPPAY